MRAETLLRLDRVPEATAAFAALCSARWGAQQPLGLGGGDGHGERSRLQLLFEYTENLSILAVNALAVHLLAVNSVSWGVSHTF